MSPFIKWFMKSSLFWLGSGVTLGVVMAVEPRFMVYRPAHVHMNLLGFVTMMIFAVGYHVLPRIAGAPLCWAWLGPIHWWLANTGLAMMVTGFFVIPSNAVVGRWILAPGGTLAAAGAFCFIVNIWRTIDIASGRAAAQAPARKGLPVNKGIV
jgi:cytochrome c oxidase cbb3-type subunit 1